MCWGNGGSGEFVSHSVVERDCEVRCEHFLESRPFLDLMVLNQMAEFFAHKLFLYLDCLYS